MQIGKIVSTGTISARDILADRIAENGPIPAARVSSAQCGSACPWSYWDAVRYEIRRRKSDGAPTAVALERASRVRRSVAAAERDLDALCEREDRLSIDRIGPVDERTAESILERLASEAAHA